VPRLDVNRRTTKLDYAVFTCGAALALFGCTGLIDGEPSGAAARGGASSVPGGPALPGGGAASVGTGGTGGTGVAVAAVSLPGLAPVRRLTHIEYDNTVADLLGDKTAPATGFSADAAQDGFTNNATQLSVSPALAEQYIAAADTLSQTATKDLKTLLECDTAAAGEPACVQQFISNFGKRAWRRPLSAQEAARLLSVFTTARATLALDVSVQLVLQTLLDSPQFLYMLEPADPKLAATPASVVPLDSWQVATRLSYYLTGSLPDSLLFAEAEKGALTTPDQVAVQARRLLALPRARDRISLFFTEWLKLRNIDTLQKDATLYPNYNLALGPMMRTQVQLFATSVILDGPGTEADLLTASYTFMNKDLAPFYGVPAPAADGFTRVELDPTKRAGLMTQVGVMATLGHENQTDPVHRGKFVRERLLCEPVPPPPPNANITPPVVDTTATTRVRFTQHRADPACSACHQLMDPIGLGFEHYDSVGVWRDTDNGQPVDATGQINGSDVAGPFNGAIELSKKLANSQEVKDCFVQTWFTFAHGRSVTQADLGNLAVVSKAFADHSFQISELLVAMTQTKSFLSELVPDPNPPPAAGSADGSGGAQ
jgi:hypothetical protein